VSAHDHDRHSGDAAAYLLGALSELERQAFERHLMGCSACRDELEHLRPAAEALPRSVAPVRPSGELKRSVMAVVESEAAPRAEPPRGARLAGRLRQRLGSLARVRPAVAWVSASFLLLAGVALGVAGSSLVRGDGERTVAVQTDRVRVPEASGSLTMSDHGRDGAILRVHGMPSLPSRSVYQVWVERHGEVVPQSIFSVGEDGAGAAAVPGDLEDAESVMVTREPAGGARAPSEKPIVSVDL